MTFQKQQQLDILVIDDMTISRQILTMLLEKNGFSNVQTARSSLDAVDTMAQKMPGLIISDFHMPGMDGIEFLTCLRADALTRDIPFILTSGDDAHPKIVASLASGSFQMLTKPIRPNHLVRAITNATGLAIAS